MRARHLDREASLTLWTPAAAVAAAVAVGVPKRRGVVRWPCELSINVSTLARQAGVLDPP
jgi:hypothetical protein